LNELQAFISNMPQRNDFSASEFNKQIVECFTHQKLNKLTRIIERILTNPRAKEVLSRAPYTELVEALRQGLEKARTLKNSIALLEIEQKQVSAKPSNIL